jgi:hypothetical protein
MFKNKFETSPKFSSDPVCLINYSIHAQHTLIIQNKTSRSLLNTIKNKFSHNTKLFWIQDDSCKQLLIFSSSKPSLFFILRENSLF